MCYLGSLYFYFSGKDEITHEVLSEATAEFMAFLSNVLGGKNPGACIDHKKHLKHGEIPWLQMLKYHPMMYTMKPW